MPKVDISVIQNLDNPNSVVAALNGNFNRIQEVIETLLSRDGRAPNSMLSILNMNDFRILNLPAPTSPTEPARHGDIQQYVDQAEAFRDEAEGFRDETLGFRNETEGFRDESEAFLTDFQSRYLGAYATDPSVDNFGQPLITGALYFNTASENWKVFNIVDVHANGDPVYAGDGLVIVGYWIPFPQANLLSLSDVDASSIDNNQLLVMSGGLFVPWDPIADNIGFDDDQTQLNATTVQEAIEDLVDRTSLGKYDISFYIQGLMDNNERLFRMVASRAFTLLAGLPDSAGSARVGANTNTSILIFKNGSQVGTVDFSASATTATFTFAGTVDFVAGDILELRAPASADTLLRDVSITIAARR